MLRRGRPILRVLDAPVPAASPPPAPAVPPWRPTRGPAAGPGYLGEPRRSIAIWVWGLLKARAWTTLGLARELGVHPRELGVHPSKITHALATLRARGHRIVCDVRDRHFIPDDRRPLRVVEHGGGLRLPRIDGKGCKDELELW